MPDPRVTAFIKLATDEPWKLYVERERADIDAHVEMRGDRFADDCGWFANDLGPCGGCDRCIAAQISHYIQAKRDETRRYALAGYAYVRDLVKAESVGSAHDCWSAGECGPGMFVWR